LLRKPVEKKMAYKKLGLLLVAIIVYLFMIFKNKKIKGILDKKGERT
jgi:hypothetical protein